MKNIILYAIPFFVITLLIELAISVYNKRKWYSTPDTFSSLSMGIGNVLIGLVFKCLIFGAYSLVYQFRIWDMPNTWWAWILLFLCDDFAYYWFHRFSHEVRYFWASHIVHHSSTKYNLSTALRQTWTGDATGGFIFWLWLPLIGFPPLLIVFMHSLSLIYQFWIHTEAIDKFPKPIEFIFNTPSHHRVHHSSQTKYLDKNYAGTLIIWDRLFGSFKEEEERPIYGLTTNINTYNPLVIAFHEWIAIGKDIWKARNIKQVLGYSFGPPGWSHDGSRKTSKELQDEL